MRVAFVTSGSASAHDEFFNDNLSGTESQIDGVANELANQGNTMGIYKVSSRNFIQKSGNITVEEVAVATPPTLLGDIYTKLRFGERCRSRLNEFNPDVVNVIMKYAASRVVREDFPMVHFAFNNPVSITPGQSSVSRLLTGHMERVISKKAECLVVRNKKNMEYWSHNSKATVQRIPVGINTKLYQQKDARDFIFYGGRFSEEKRVNDLITAYRSLPEDIRQKNKLLLCGEGPTKEKIQERAESEKIGEICILPWQRKSDFIDLLSQCKLYVLPSAFEGMPVVLIEAMATGTPVVASNIAGVNDVLTEDVGRLFPVGDVDQLSQQMETLLRSGEEYNRLSRNAYMYSRENYSFSAIAKQYTDLYRRMINNT